MTDIYEVNGKKCVVIDGRLFVEANAAVMDAPIHSYGPSADKAAATRKPRKKEILSTGKALSREELKEKLRSRKQSGGAPVRRCKTCGGPTHGRGKCPQLAAKDDLPENDEVETGEPIFEEDEITDSDE